MYNPVTSREIRMAPPLEGLDIERLPQKLTEAYARIVSARISMAGMREDTSLQQLLDEISRIAHTYLTLVNFAPTPAIQKSAAFVSGSAFELIARSGYPYPTADFTPTSICPLCCAALLFIIADSPTDSMEIIRYAEFSQESGSLHEALKQSIRGLAYGEFDGINNSDFAEIRTSDDSLEQAASILYRRCLEGISDLSIALIEGGSIEKAISIFEETKVQCISDCSDLLDEHIAGVVPYSTFPGPFLLASLLMHVGQRLFDHALVNIPVPDMRHSAEWTAEIKRLARVGLTCGKTIKE